MTTAAKTAIMLETLKDASIKFDKTYSGRVGCMCGCKGKYTEGLNKTILKKAIALLESGEASEVDVNFNGGYVYVANSENTRCYAFYFIHPALAAVKRAK